MNLIQRLTILTSRESLEKQYPKESIGLLQALNKVKNLLEGWIAAYYFVNLEYQIDELDKHVNVKLVLLFKDYNLVLNKCDLVKISFRGRSNELWALNPNQRECIGIPTCLATHNKIQGISLSIQQLIEQRLST